MLKKLLTISFSGILFLTLTSFVVAKESSEREREREREEHQFTPEISVTQAERIQEREEKMMELKERIEEKKASVSARLEERKRVRVEGFWQKLTTRLSAAVDRLDMLIQRIESRLSTIEQNNPDEDTTDIHEQLDQARNDLADAKTKLSALDEIAQEALGSENPKDAFEVVRESIKEVKELLVEVHRTLVHVIGDVRGLRVGQEDLNGVTATPTVEVTVTPTVVVTATPSPEPTITPTI